MNIPRSTLILFPILITSLIIAGEGQTYGADLTLKDTTQITHILSNPEQYVEKRVLIKGSVVDVCSHRGCWIDIASEKSQEIINVKVEDGVIVFPSSAKGHVATVEGVVEKLHFSKEEMCEKLKRMAEEKGEPFDSSKVTIEEKIIYRIRGLGAVIEE